MCPSAPRVCSEPGGQKPVLSLSLDLIGSDHAHIIDEMLNLMVRILHSTPLSISFAALLTNLLGCGISNTFVGIWSWLFSTVSVYVNQYRLVLYITCSSLIYCCCGTSDPWLLLASNIPCWVLSACHCICAKLYIASSQQLHYGILWWLPRVFSAKLHCRIHWWAAIWQYIWISFWNNICMTLNTLRP